MPICYRNRRAALNGAAHFCAMQQQRSVICRRSRLLRPTYIGAAAAADILAPHEADSLRKAQKIIANLIRVDDFSSAEMQQAPSKPARRSSTAKSTAKSSTKSTAKSATKAESKSTKSSPRKRSAAKPSE